MRLTFPKGIPSGFHCQWGVAGGSPFKDYKMLNPQQSATSFFKGEYLPYQASDFENQSELVVVFAKEEVATVTCNYTADGESAGTKSVEINVRAPIYTHIGSQSAIGHMALVTIRADGSFAPPGLGRPFVANEKPNAYKLWGSGVYIGANNNIDAGMHDAVDVRRPGFFGGQVGLFGYLQLVTPRSKFNGAYNPALPVVYTSNGFVNVPVESLDAHYPYTRRDPDTDALDKAPLRFADSPGLSGINVLDDPQGTYWDHPQEYIEDQDFKLYVMYLPPDRGLGSCNVPLTARLWQTRGSARRPARGVWMVTPDNSSKGQFSRYPPHPTWNWCLVP